jgi:choline-sulfatase
MMARSALARGALARGALARGALLAVVAAAWRAPGDTRPNIVLYFPDTIAAEAFGPSYGNPITRTPHFDAWAANATVFDVAWSSYPQCSPSRAALVTGRHVHTLGHRTMTHLVQPDEPNLWRMLKESGYSTLNFGKNDCLAQASFPLSYSYWQGDTGVAQGPCPYAYEEAGYYSFMAGASTHAGDQPAFNGDLRAVYQALALLNTSRVREPFALFLPGLGAHPPYGVPSDYASMYDPATIRAKAPLRSLNDTFGKPPYYGQATGIRAFRNYSTFNDDFAYQVAAQYLARVTYSDYVFGELLKGLTTLSLMDRTAVAFSSDHGDFMGNFGLVEKWSGGGDELLLHVPLALSVPGRAGGAHVAQPVQIFDLLPTFLELAGIDSWLVSDENVTGYVQFGNSLLPWLPAEDGSGGRAPATHDFVYAEAGYYYQNEVSGRARPSPAPA